MGKACCAYCRGFQQLMKLAGELDKPIWNVESGQEQLEMFSGFSDALQELMRR